ncbi:alpha/beta hydrolase fold protein [Tepiditoga spiralis]|uniref:Alpha/beta hydrolase fold protein n=1 Tax=Tepiditoga spiralis TaxID=2108365 RepID=A0A7G1GBZ9_9BACT|nr:alpha/beta hydrolase [Tepiditoga spiralis]BBE31539.1 alpha/beta hydrolase fold protein [Tepiditoga spiralis]
MLSKNKKINYEIHGSGKPLVLLNGIMMNTLSWVEHVKILEKYFTVITYDMRDQGMSLHEEKKYDISIHVNDLNELIGELNLKKINLLGLSYGGMVSQLFTLKFPEKVDKLILSNTVDYVDNYLKVLGQLWIQAAKLYDGEKFFDIALPIIYSRNFYNNNYDWLMSRRKIFKDYLNKDWYDGFIRLAESNKEFDVRNKIETIKSDTLILAGDEDIITPLNIMKNMNKKIKNSTLKVFNETGHGMFLEKMNEYLNICIKFIK